ncbi:MAG: PLD nuclease N-terminal domain-containing protein [Bacillota bacterium]|jgi:hypothetical protein
MEEFLIQYWPLLIPIAIINYVLVIAALVDLFRRERVLGNRKWVWAVLILFIQYIGPILYFVLGRKE